MKKGMMISCKDATELVVRKDIEELSWWDKMRLSFHLAMCRFCNLFRKQSAVIDAASQELDDKTFLKMPMDTKDRIIKEIRK